MSNRATARAIVLTVFTLAVAFASSAQAETTGALFQDLSSASCFHDLGGGGCTTAFGLSEPTDIAASPDGLSLYVASHSQNADQGAVAAFSRNPTTGAIVPLAGTAGCIAESATAGAAGHCAPGIGLLGAKTVAVSPDGEFVYVGGEDDLSTAAIAIFSRDATTGALSQLPGTSGCLTGTGANADARCTTFAGELGDPADLVISPDGQFVYVANPDTPTGGDVGNVDVFARDATTGLLTFASCTKEVPGATGCSTGRATREPKSIAFSPGPDATHVYVAASEGVSTTDQDGAVAIFDRDATTGALTQHGGTNGCINVTGNDGSGASTCRKGIALHDANSIVVSPDGNSVYLATQGENNSTTAGFITYTAIGSLVNFHRDPVTGDLTHLDGCVTFDGSNGYEDPPATPVCDTGRSFEPSSVAVSPDNASVYVAYSDEPGAVATFARDTSTGAVSQLDGAAGCVSGGGLDGTFKQTCTLGNGLAGANAVLPLAAVGRPGCVHVYAASMDDNAVAVLTRKVECAPPAVVKPAATTGPASAITANGATLNGTIDPGTATTTYMFEYGTTANYGLQTAGVSVAAARSAGARAAGPRGVSAVLDGLQVGRTYHYRLVATNSAGSANGADVTFVAKAARKAPKSLKLKAKFAGGKLTVSGKLGLPAGVSKAAGCTGKVTIQVKAGKKLLAKRAANVKKTCSFSAKFNLASKVSGHPRLKVSGRFGGSAALTAKSSKSVSVKT